MADKRIFVTGVGSFIGGYLCQACDAEGYNVTGIDAVAVERDNCHVADIRDPDIADLIPERVDAVIHLAAISRDSDCKGRMSEVLDVNVAGTSNVANAAEARNARQLIFASTEWVYDNLDALEEKRESDTIDCAALKSEYAFSKYMAENVLRIQLADAGLAATVLRLGIIYGLRRHNWSAVEALLAAVLEKEEVVVGSRDTGRHFIHVSDVAQAMLSCIGRAGFDIFNVQGPRLVTLGEIVDTAARLLGRSPVVCESAPENPSVRRISGERIRQVIGWEPAVGIEDGLRSVIDHLAPSGVS